ncbi:methyltransferase domain-containing protein [Shewanella morhuae]|uniref:Malonyl-CoA O-methyltransferase BioC n=1 Tax=Shewanella morhuae TaxID=365591 RepID=A0A379ZP37_9GAMM|nr:methyltransferase domain-containing protein [Shewanella morhuae]SUI64756.1 Malonyl-CoA O-methyltransferase BioC [Shewanella morhuae]
MPSLKESEVIKPVGIKPHTTEAKIAQRFSAAAHSYQDHNKLQRLSADSLLSGLLVKGNLLDIGAGPGTDFSACYPNSLTDKPSSAIFAVDIALGMLHKLKQSYPDYHGVCADAQYLPFSDNSMDVIYSNLALQWCADFPAAVTEMARVLRPHGECHVTLVAEGSLNQLAQLGLRVNEFSSLVALKTAFKLDIWQYLDVQLIPMTVYFDTLKALIYSIKGVGASVQSAHSSSAISDLTPQLRGRQDWQIMQAKAEALRLPKGLPLTYQIVQIRGRRNADK